MEKKLKLNLDDLKVESFSTNAGDESARGTVVGLTSPDQCPCEETIYEPCHNTQDPNSNGCTGLTDPEAACYTNDTCDANTVHQGCGNLAAVTCLNNDTCYG